MSDARVEESGAITFTVSLSTAGDREVSVDFETVDDSAAAGSDYESASGTLVFAPGETSKQVTVATLQDAVLEGDEQFRLVISNAEGATIIDPTGIGTILDDDSLLLGEVTAHVSEEGLAGANPDTEGSPDTTDQANVSGTIPLGDMKDPAQLQLTLTSPEQQLSVHGVAVEWSGNDTQTLLGSAGGLEVIRITIDNSGNYWVSLSAGLDHLGDSGAEGELSFGIGIAATYGDISSASSTLTISVEDDMPLVSFTNGIVENSAGAMLIGSLLSSGADIPLGMTLSGAPPSGLSYAGEPVVYAIDGATLTATAGATTVFTLNANDDGSYSFDLLQPLDLSVLSTDFSDASTAGGPATYYLYEDGSFGGPDASKSWAVRVSGTSDDGSPGSVNPSTQGMGVDNNWLDADESIRFEFDHDGTSGAPDPAYFARIGIEDIDSGESLRYSAVFSDGTSITVANAAVVSGFLDVRAPDGLYLNSLAIDVTGAGNHTAVRLTTIDLYTRSTDQSVELNFGFSGAEYDGDTVSGNFSVTLQGAATLTGTANNDALGGGPGQDTLIGGGGDDILTGGAGSDVFAWSLGDQGSFDQPAHDIITDFNLADTPDGGDVLALGDLLPGATPDNLGAYLQFEQQGDNAVLKISTTGDFSNGYDQSIELLGLNFSGLGDEQAILNDLLSRGKLSID